MRNKLFALVSVLMILSMLLAACGTQEVVKTVEVEKVTTVEVVKEGETVVVTATPEPEVAAEFKSKDPNTFTYATFGGPETLDPALDYESAGIELIMQVYETLVTYNREKPSDFVPLLASEYNVSDDGKTYTFKLRSGIKFHDGADLTPSDVAYSFQRGVLQGGTASPQWLLTEPFFGVGIDDVSVLVDPEGNLYDDQDGMKAADPAKLVEACEKVMAAVVADDAAGTVTFNLAQPWGPFIATIANAWGSVMDKDWTAANGGWDGSCDTWQNYYATTSENDPFNDKMNGTGPYKFDHWTQNEEFVLVRNPDYWRTEPLWEGAPTGPAAIERVVYKYVNEWGTRFAMMQAGDADTATVPAENRPQIDDLVGETCEFDAAKNDSGPCQSSGDEPFRVFKGLPPVTRTDAFMTFQVNTSPDSPNPLLGSGKLDGNGVPPDFFSDVHIRRAFNYCFDWDLYISEALNGEGVQAIGVPLPGMPGYDPNGPKYTYDAAKCEEEFKAADLDKDGIPAGDDPEGDVWTTGFRLQVAYNTGSQTRLTLAQILQDNIAAVNEKFSIEILAIPWATFLRNQREQKLPMFFVGWIEDIHDPHNWYQPYVIGTYGRRQGLAADLKEEFTKLINAGVSEADPEKRAQIYYELNQKYYDAAPIILLAYATGRHYEQRWVQGYFYNPIAPLFYYNLSKK